MEDLNILLLGNGGREHALAWKLNQSSRVKRIHVLPGNGGTAVGLSKVQNVGGIDLGNFEAVMRFAKEHDANLVIPGPEVPLVAGIEMACRAGKVPLSARRFLLLRSQYILVTLLCASLSVGLVGFASLLH